MGFLASPLIFFTAFFFYFYFFFLFFYSCNLFMFFIGCTIRIGQESWCPPYAGFFKIVRSFTFLDFSYFFFKHRMKVAVLYSSLQFSTVLYSFLQFSTVLYIYLHFSTFLYISPHFSTFLHISLHFSTVLYSSLHSCSGSCAEVAVSYGRADTIFPFKGTHLL